MRLDETDLSFLFLNLKYINNKIFIKIMSCLEHIKDSEN